MPLLIYLNDPLIILAIFILVYDSFPGFRLLSMIYVIINVLIKMALMQCVGNQRLLGPKVSVLIVHVCTCIANSFPRNAV